jgi:membrane protein
VKKTSIGPSPGTARLIGNALVQAIRDTFADNATQWAAAIAYYSFLSLFPLLLAAVSLSAYFVSPDWAVGKSILLLRELVPEGDAAIQRIIHDAVHAAHPYAGVVSLLILLVLGSRAFGALSRALNIAYEGIQTGSMVRRIVIEIGMMAAVGVLFTATLFSHYLLRFLWGAVRLLPGDTGPAFDAIVQLIRVLLLLTAFFLIYRFVPRKRLDWKSIAVGAVVATSLFVAARPLFYGYVENLANYNLMYGGIAIAVVLLAWAWVTAFITILGGESASHFQSMVLERAAAKTVDRKRMEPQNDDN